MDSDGRRWRLGGLLAQWLRGRLGALVVTVIDSIMESVDALLALIPNPVPTAGQLRRTRKRGREQLRGLGRITGPARRPALASVGAGELLLQRWWLASAVTA